MITYRADVKKLPQPNDGNVPFLPPVYQWKNCTTAIIEVGTGIDAVESEKLAAVIDWVERQPNFKCYFLVLADSLQAWHREDASGALAADARATARRLGDEWLSANSALLNLNKKPRHIRRWDALRKDKSFDAIKRNFLSYCELKPGFRDAVDGDVRKELLRRNSKQGDISERSYEYMWQAILERLSVHAVLQQSLRNTARLYLGTVPEADKFLKGEGMSQEQIVLRLDRVTFCPGPLSAFAKRAAPHI